MRKSDKKYDEARDRFLENIDEAEAAIQKAKANIDMMYANMVRGSGQDSLMIRSAKLDIALKIVRGEA